LYDLIDINMQFTQTPPTLEWAGDTPAAGVQMFHLIAKMANQCIHDTHNYCLTWVLKVEKVNG